MSKKINILHVDDSNTIKLYIKILLMEVPVIKAIESADTIAQGKEMLAKNETDVVILDINLPDGSGLELLEWIRKYHPALKVIVFSNNSDQYFRNAAQKAGADHFLDKSMEFEDLIKTLKKIQTK